jgi:hypothetical protein
MNGDCLDQEIVFFRSPGPADDFFGHDIRSGTEDEYAEREGYSERLWDRFLSDRLPNSHDCSSSAVFDLRCHSSKATPPARMKARCLPLTTHLDSVHSPLRRNHAWSRQNRRRLFHILPQMYSQKYATPLADFNLRMLKQFITGPLKTNLAYHPTHRYADECEHHL